MASIGTRQDTVSVLVTPILVTGVEISPSILELEKGVTDTLTASVSPGNAADMTIQWISGNDTLISVDQSGIINALAAGQTYIIALNEASGIRDTCWITVLSIVDGLKDLDTSVRIFPNPAGDMLHIEGLQEEANIALINLAGIHLSQINQTSVNLRHLDPGIYFIRIETGNRMIMKRFIKY